MFFFKKGRPAEPSDYQQRISELESELNNARRLIVDQQHVLRANLEAIADGGADGAGEPEMALPRQTPRTGASYAEQPPITLPDFGPPAGDIAGTVLRAAALKGVIDDAPSNTDTATAASNRPAPEPVVPLTRAAPSRDFPIIVCTVLLLGGALIAVAWSRVPWSGLVANSGPVQSTQSQAADVAVSHNVARIKAPAPAVHANTGPVLEPVSEKPIPIVAPDVATHTRQHVRAVRYARAAAPEHPRVRSVRQLPEINSEPPRAASDTVDRAPTRPATAVAFHRRPRKRQRQASAARPGQDWFEREARRHPAPGWDEEDDKWLDRF